MFMEEDSSSRINKERIRQAKNIKATTIVTSCPFCKTMLSDGVNNEEIEITDIVDLIVDKIQ